MKYLVVQEWNNTKGNHAGMSHMCDMLVDNYPEEYKKVTKQTTPNVKQRSGLFGRLLHKVEEYYAYKKNVKEYFEVCADMLSKLKEGDSVFLLEYNWKPTSQYELAKYIRNNYPEVKIFGLSHITPTWYSEIRGIRKQIRKWDLPLDRQLTLGSSLSEYFVSLGISKDKVSTGFHYVDSFYYNKSLDSIKKEEPICIITMGFLQRDYNKLAEIVNCCPDISWIICRGSKKEVDTLFDNRDNVKICGYMPEDELRTMMDSATISLNIMEDTVGSNVITTSMAMGLAILVTDVGSIRDYCDENNAVFLKNSTNEIIAAIKSLDKSKVYNMRRSSLCKVDSITIDKVHRWFSSL